MRENLDSKKTYLMFFIESSKYFFILQKSFLLKKKVKPVSTSTTVSLLPQFSKINSNFKIKSQNVNNSDFRVTTSF